MSDSTDLKRPFWMRAAGRFHAHTQLARQLLALNYTDYSPGKQSLIQRKRKYEEAIALVRGRDQELEKHLSYQLHLINEMIDAKKEATEFDSSQVVKPLLKYW